MAPPEHNPRATAAAPASTGSTCAALPRSLPLWARVGVVLFFLTACAYGVLEVHFSTDTWIALAAGRQILSAPQFPKTDTFSYTFYGQVWFNQNWLSHVLFWVLYDRIAPAAVVIGTWALGAGIFTLVLLATHLRSRSWFAAALAAALVAIGTRDWLSPRPATVQFFLLASLWLALQAWLSADSRRHWWPVVLLAAVLSIWPHAHGSFLLGFGLVGLFLACAAAARLSGSTTSISGWQAAGMTITLLAAAVLAAALSPFGFENYTHPFTIAESEIFRRIGEWKPPWGSWSVFPPVHRFWGALAVAAAAPLIVLYLRRQQSAAHPAVTRASRRPPYERLNRQVILFDLAAVVVGLGLALSARRFAPIFYILATPALVAATLRWARPLAADTRASALLSLSIGAWGAVALVAATTGYLAHRDLLATFPADRSWDLLDRVTRADAIVRSGLDFLSRNNLPAKVLAEWKQAGPLMHYAPCARVFIDGRAQQLYSEDLYKTYLWVFSTEAAKQPDATHAVLTRYGTDAVLLPKWRTLSPQVELLDRHPQWLRAVECRTGILWIRLGTPLADEIARRERDNDLWWPDSPLTDLARGLWWVRTQPTDPSRAVALWRQAVARNPVAGLEAYGWIVKATRGTPQAAETAAYLRAERQRIDKLTDLSPETRQSLLDVLQKSEELLRR